MRKRQTSFVFRKEGRKDNRGGPREGAGRPRKTGRRNVPHRGRPPHDETWPVLITLRGMKNLPSFRHELVLRMLKNLLHAQPKRLGSAFRVPHFSIQSDHLHLIVEAE